MGNSQSELEPVPGATGHGQQPGGQQQGHSFAPHQHVLPSACSAYVAQPHPQQQRTLFPPGRDPPLTSHHHPPHPGTRRLIPPSLSASSASHPPAKQQRQQHGSAPLPQHPQPGLQLQAALNDSAAAASKPSPAASNIGRPLPASLTASAGLQPQPASNPIDLTGHDSPLASTSKQQHKQAGFHGSAQTGISEQQITAAATQPFFTVDLTHEADAGDGRVQPVQQPGGVPAPGFVQASLQPHPQHVIVDLTQDTDGCQPADRRARAPKRMLPPSIAQQGPPPSKVQAGMHGAGPVFQHEQQQLLLQQQQRNYESLLAQQQQQLNGDEYFLSFLNHCDKEQHRYTHGLTQMTTLLEAGEYAGKPLKPDQVDKARQHMETCAQKLQLVGNARQQCLDSYEDYIAKGRPAALSAPGLPPPMPRMLPHSLDPSASAQPAMMCSSSAMTMPAELEGHLAQDARTDKRSRQEAEQAGAGGLPGSESDAPNPSAKRQKTEAEDGSSGAEPCVDHKAALKAVMENLSLTGQEEIEPRQNSLVVPIMRHQKMALAWMCKREMSDNPQGGILADDQGLGKTVSAIALIVTNTPDPTADRKASHKSAGPSTVPSSSSPKTQSPTKSSDPQAAASAGTAPGQGALPSQPQSAQPSRQPQQEGGLGPTCDDELCTDPADLHPGGTLVVCPTSVLHQWHREMRDKVNLRAGFSVCVYHGKDKVMLPSLLCKYTVVLTTYGTLAMEAPAKPEGKAGKKQQQMEEEESAFGKEEGRFPLCPSAPKSKGVKKSDEGGILYRIFWHRVMLDEAQSIKNVRTMAAHAAFQLHATHRWCMSGTPIQNSVDDLFAYFKFLRYRPYNDAAKFKVLLKDRIARNPEDGYKVLQLVLQSILLRRTKSTKLGDDPIVNLPPREQELLQPEFTSQEAEFYKAVQDDGMRALEQNTKEHGGKEQYVNMLYYLLKMRQACNHPWLVKGLGQRYSKGGSSRPASAAELAAARKLDPEQRTTLLSLVQHPQAQCPVCGDLPEDPVVGICGHVYCQQCAAAQLESTGQEDEFQCTTCSCPLRSACMYSAAALSGNQQQGQQGQPCKAAAKGGAAAKKGGAGSDAPWASSTKVDQLMQVLQRIINRTSGSTANGTFSSTTTAPAPGSAQPPGPPRSKVNSKLAKMFKPLTSPAPCQPPGRAPAGAPAGAAGSTAGGAQQGSKSGVRRDKVIVFSQWTSMLDLLEQPLGAANISYRRLDGTMSVVQRERAIIDFEDQPEVMVLLVSLKAAALGVNLTCANHVVLMDLWWNPTVEEQAIDRAHRIGQTRTVHVTRLAIKGTVEERILELQARKRALVAAALEEGREGADAANKLTMEDLRYLFLGAPPAQGAAAPHLSPPTGSGLGPPQSSTTNPAPRSVPTPQPPSQPLAPI